jgi:protein CpxP
MRKTLIPTLVASLFALTLPMGGQAETSSVSGPLAQASDSRGHHEGRRAHAHDTHKDMRGQGGMMRMSHHAGKAGTMSPRAWLRGLDLSEAQRDKVFAIMHAEAPKMREQAKLIRAARTELNGHATAAVLDPAQLKAASDKLARAMADMSASRVGTRNQIFQLLTPEQRQQVQARLAKAQGRGGDGGHGMGSGSHGGHGMGPGGHRSGHHGEGHGNGRHGHGNPQRGASHGTTPPTQAS